MWEWPTDHFRTRDLADEPALAQFAGGLVVSSGGLLEVERSVVSRYDLLALPLVEWDHSTEASGLFAALRRAGSKRGFFIDYPGQADLGHHFRECDLSEASATAVCKNDLFGWATIFVDDGFQLVLATWFTDFTHLCMSPALFDDYLSANPILLDIRGSEEEAPARTFSVALIGAKKRQDDWTLILKEMQRKGSRG